MNQKGSVMTEIVCIVVLVAVAAIASIGFIGTSTSNNFTNMANNLGCANPAERCDVLPGGGRQKPPRDSGYNSSSGPSGGYNPGLGGGNN